ncbi:DMT family transporter [Rubeoparvulum massiliense]|uniref:DMT family transporter n=1 Tax=Rubeoparvulum massiliense TaxID=1631346 RepID=UPI00065E76E5|nr:DMT family transporter [Rubeoparvulum massiliense]
MSGITGNRGSQPTKYVYGFFIAIAVFAIGSAAIFVKLVDAPPAVSAFYRLFFSFLLMTPLVLHPSIRQSLHKMTKRDWWLAFLSGFFLALHFVLWFQSLAYTSVASSVVLVTMQPLFAVLGSYYLFKSKTPLIGWLFLLLALSGGVMIGWGDFQVAGKALWGDILALLGALTITIYWLIGQQIRQHLPLFAYTYVVYGASSLILGLYVFVMRYSFITYSTRDFLYFLAMAIIPTLLGHTILNGAIKYVSATTISMAILGEPIGASILAYFILGEALTSNQWIGGSIILLGLVGYLLQESKSIRSQKSKE